MEQNPKKYVGKTCTKHPDLGGLRHKTSRTCVGCHRDLNYASRKRARAKLAEMAIAIGRPLVNPAVSGPHHIGAICALHPELMGARRKDYYCIQCNRDRQERWKAVHREDYLAEMRRRAGVRRTRDATIKADYLKLVVSND